MDSYNSPTTKSLFKGTQIVWYALSLLEIILAFRFILKLTGANPDAGFVNFTYSLTSPFIAPFSAVFPTAVVQNGVLEWGTALAMIVYWMVAVAIIKLLLISKTVSTGEAASELDRQDL